VLKRDFKTEEQEITERISLFLEIIKLVEPKAKINEIKEDPTDNKFLECAVEAKADYIISGDKHLLKIKKFKETKILTPNKFLDILK